MVISALAKEKTMRIILLAIAFVSVFLQIPARFCLAEDPATSEEQPMHQRIYFLQHRLLPKWTYQSEGMFFDDLMQNRTQKLMAAASDIVGEAFAREISFRSFPEAKGVLITFSPPKEIPECFFVYIAKKGDGFKFYTYEKTLDLGKSGDKGVIGEWKADGAHGNLGPRKYDDPDSFVRELQESK
jgi:hypothetical protein